MLIILRLTASPLHLDDRRGKHLRQLVLQTPAPVVARMLGYDGDTATRLSTAAGSPWSRYAPGDHEQ
ncbi:hypothetical protein AB0H88_47800 [Nonomuraea sp. NPDC050680]|uniref:hypothetical protein n=1 Tax=Nonomuraea sp. NPDC050680 TaxID=3154630 RepID=UPI0033ED8908